MLHTYKTLIRLDCFEKESMVRMLVVVFIMGGDLFKIIGNPEFQKINYIGINMFFFDNQYFIIYVLLHPPIVFNFILIPCYPI